MAAPKSEPVPPALNFAALDEAAAELSRSAARYDRALEKALSNASKPMNNLSLTSINEKLIESERRLTDSQGLSNRPWFKHQIYAPGFYTGYGVKTLPGVREAVEQKRWEEANAGIARAGRVLRSEADLVNAAAEELERIAR